MVDHVLRIEKSLPNLALWRDSRFPEIVFDVFEGAITSPPGVDLFDDVRTPLFRLTENDHVKSSAVFLSSLTPESFEKAFSHGLLIECVVTGIVLKKLVAECERLGVQVSRTDTTPESVLEPLRLSSEARQFLLSYAGDDAELLVPIVRTLKESPEKVQSRVTVEDLVVRLPRPPGSIPPWDVTNAILTRVASDAITVRRRFARTSNDLIWVVTTRKKFDTLRKVAVLIEEGATDSVVQKALGLQPKGYSFLKRDAKRLGSLRASSLLDTISACEAALKGHSAAPKDSLVEKAILELCSKV